MSVVSSDDPQPSPQVPPAAETSKSAPHVADGRRIVRTLLRRGTKFDIELVDFTRPGGRSEPVTREVIRHPGSIIVIPLLQVEPAPAPPRLVLIENFRISLERSILELPAGTRTPGEAPEVCAARELAEETGYRAQHLQQLCSWLTAPGLTDERMHCFIARDLTPLPAGQALEDDEDIRVRVVELAAAFTGCRDGTIEDAKTLLALAMLERTLAG